jgi:hypothetical protein
MSPLDIFADHRKEQIENGPFSESFIITTSGDTQTVKGIYDESYVTQEQDSGKVRQQMRKPVILIAEIPTGIIPRTSKIDVRGLEYTVQKIDRDSEGVPRIWLL